MSGAAGGAGTGALSGASTGAMIGSIIPGIGTAIGGAVGALGGALAGGLGGSAQEQKAKQMAAMGATQSMAMNNPQAGVPKLLESAAQFAPRPGQGGSAMDDVMAKVGAGYSPDAGMGSWIQGGYTPPTAPIAQPQTGGTAQNNMTPGQIPQVEPPNPWMQGLAGVAMTQDMLMKQQAMRPKPQPSSPNLFVPQGMRAPTLGSPLPRSESPLQRYAMMLRR